MKLLLAIFLILISSLSASSQSNLVDRPPQFVALAFDGSKSLYMWKNTQAFAKENNIKFTYFISGVYFLHSGNRTHYKAPRRSAGRSGIGWGASTDDIKERLEQVNLAVKNGHEIASHANGHFDGSDWTHSEWTQEFTEFDKLMENAYSYNQLNSIEPRSWMSSIVQQVTGFRAPLLGDSLGLWTTLSDFDFRYDTSKVASMNHWPQKVKNSIGSWEFPLASIRIAGSGIRTLSMDYNFYYAQSKAKKDLANAKKYEDQMYNTYVNYFLSNYHGNRAPIDIGHHFSLWNGGAYWKALKRFAKTVCHLPEVKCVTYRELANFMDSTNLRTRMAYSKGQFEKIEKMVIARHSVPPPPLDVDIIKVPSRINGLAKFVAVGTSVSADMKFQIEGPEGMVISESGQERGDLEVIVNLRNTIKSFKEEKLKVNIVLNDDVIQVQTYDLNFNKEHYIEISEKSEETYGLIGDMPEAHDEE